MARAFAHGVDVFEAAGEPSLRIARHAQRSRAPRFDAHEQARFARITRELPIEALDRRTQGRRHRVGQQGVDAYGAESQLVAAPGQRRAFATGKEIPYPLSGYGVVAAPGFEECGLDALLEDDAGEGAVAEFARSKGDDDTRVGKGGRMLRIAHAVGTEQSGLGDGGHDLTAGTHTEAVHGRRDGRGARVESIVGVAESSDIRVLAVACEVHQGLGMFDAQTDLEGFSLDDETLIDVSLDGECTASIDRDLVLRAMEEILVNACTYSAEGGSVKVEVSGAEKEISIRVTDSGVGIPQEEFSQVFDEGFVGSNQVKEGEGGQGVGLALVRKVVEAHGGSVWVESEKGRGTRISLTIPRASATP